MIIYRNSEGRAMTWNIALSPFSIENGLKQFAEVTFKVAGEGFWDAHWTDGPEWVFSFFESELMNLVALADDSTVV